MIECPALEQLDALLSGDLSHEEFAGIEAHVDACGNCQQTLEGLCAGERTMANVVEHFAQAPSPVGNWDEHRAVRLADAVREAQWDSLAGSSSARDTDLPVIPGHEILGLIGQGGMGTVYRGTQLDLGREVAVKVLDARAARDLRQLSQRFAHEAQVTANLDHPSIVPVHAIGRDATNRCYYTMRLVRGRELKEVLPLAGRGAEGWSRSRAIGVLIRVCQTIAYAHTHGVVHRDLKPSNVMVGGLGEVYVLDWGLARAKGHAEVRDLRLEIDEAKETHSHSGTLANHDALGSTLDLRVEDRRRQGNAPVSSHGTSSTSAADGSTDRPLLTMDGAVIGTPTYMPPEQAAGNLDQVDQRSDVYALGTMLYQLLTGAAPYTSGDQKTSSLQILKAVLAGPPEPIQDLAPSAPPELIAICEKAMARQRDERYASALELAEELEAFLDQRVVRAYQTGALAEAKKWVIRNRSVAAAGLLAIAAILGGLLVNTWREHRSNRDLSAANQQVTEALSEQTRVTNELEKSNEQLGFTNQQLETTRQRVTDALAAQQRVSGELEKANEQLGATNTQLAKANTEITAAKESEQKAKLEAYSLLAESYANFGVQEADQNRLARGALWFTKAAELSDQHPELQGSYRMTALQFRQAARFPMAAWWDRQDLKKRGWLDWPMTEQFFFDPTKRYLLARGRPGTAIFDLLNDAEPLWSNTRFAFAAFSPTRDVVAVVTKKQEVSIRRFTDQEIVQEISPEGNGTVKALDYSHDGRLLFIGTSPAKVWDVERSRYFGGHYPIGEWVHDMGFSPDDEEFLVESQQALKVFKIVDADGVQQPTSTLEKGKGRNEEERELRSRFTLRMRYNTEPKWPDGTDFDREALDHFGQHGDVSLHGTAFNAESNQIAFAHGHGIFRLWQAPTRPYWFIRTDGLARPAFSPDSMYVAAVGHLSLTDDDVPVEQRKPELLSTQVFDSATGQPVSPEIRVGVPILDGCFSPERPLLAFACAVRERRKKTTFLPDGQSGTVQLWDWQTGQMHGEPFPMPSEPQAIAWHPTRDQIAVGCAAGQVLKIDIVSREVTEIYNREMKSTPWLLAPGEWDSIGLAFDPTGDILSWWGGLKAQLLNFSKGGIRFEPSFGSLWTNIEIHNDVCLFSYRNHGPLALRITKRTGFKWIKQKDVDKMQPVGTGSLARLSQDGRYVVSSATSAGQTSVFDIEQGQMAASFGEGAVDVNFIHNTPVIITAGDATPDSVRFWDRHSGHMAAPTQHIPGSRFTGWIRVAENGQFAAMTCTPYGLLVFDLRSLHEDPAQGLSQADVMLLAEINAGASINDGKLTKLGGPEWISRWDEFRSRHPNFHSQAIPLSLTIRDHQTRAHEFDILKNAAAAMFHRQIADRLLASMDDVAPVVPDPIAATPSRDEDQLADLTSAIESNSNDALLWRARAEWYGSEGQWQQSAHDLGQVLKLLPDESAPYLHVAPIHILAGDRSGYGKVCLEMLERFGSSTNDSDVEQTIKTCLLLPDAVELASLPIDTLDSALAEEAPSTSMLIWGSAARALYSYRSGEFQAAIDWTHKALEHAITDQQRVFAWTVQAMSLQQLGQSEAAHEVLNKATRKIDENLVNFGRAKKLASWQDWLIADVLRQEARQAMMPSNQE